MEILKWPLRPFVRIFFKTRNWIAYREPQITYRLFWKSRGYTWIDYYSHRLNKYAADDIANNRFSTDPTRLNRYVENAKDQFHLLKKYGLLPEHRFLDYGCGHLRLANWLAPYLLPKHYTGIDISQKRLEFGQTFLKTNGILPDQYTVYAVNDCLLRELEGQQFDYVWANSVFTHMPRPDILQMLHALKSLLKPESRFLFTFSHLEKTKIIGKDYYYTFSDMEAICREAGYQYSVVETQWPVSFSAVAEIRLT